MWLHLAPRQQTLTSEIKSGCPGQRGHQGQFETLTSHVESSHTKGTPHNFTGHLKFCDEKRARSAYSDFDKLNSLS